MKPTKFHKNEFRSNDFTYADAVKYVDSRTVRSENLSTPNDQAMENWQRLKYEEAKRRADALDRRDMRLSVQDAILSFVCLSVAFSACIWVITHYSH